MKLWYIIEETYDEEYLTTEKPKYSEEPGEYGQHWTSGVYADWIDADCTDDIIENIFNKAREISLKYNINPRKEAVPLLLEVNLIHDS